MARTVTAEPFPALVTDQIAWGEILRTSALFHTSQKKFKLGSIFSALIKAKNMKKLFVLY